LTITLNPTGSAGGAALGYGVIATPLLLPLGASVSHTYRLIYDRFKNDSFLTRQESVVNHEPSSPTPAVTGRSRRRWRRRLLRSLATVVALVLACGGWVVYQNTYDIREEQVTITGGSHPLKGVLALPATGRKPFGLVVFVHGDGPMDATRETFYRPAWEAIAKAGYASLSWNKPGVQGAPGNWLRQSMQDRAQETLDAIAWAKTRPDIDPARIGLWGS
jgi:uncharacterized protein